MIKKIRGFHFIVLSKHVLKFLKDTHFIQDHWDKIVGVTITLFLIGPYGFSDDYGFLESSKNFTKILESAISQGRPFLGLSVFFEYRFIARLNDFIYIHIILGITFILLLSLLKKILSLIMDKKQTNLSFIGVLATISSAGFTVIAGWGVELAPLMSIDLALFGILRILQSKDTKISGYLLMVNE